MRIFWTDLAKANLKEIHAYLKIRASANVAKAIISKIIERTQILRDQPEMGQLEDNPVVVGRGFRYLVEGNYKIVYKVFSDDNAILIATVFDTRQDPKRLKV